MQVTGTALQYVLIIIIKVIELHLISEFLFLFFIRICNFTHEILAGI